MRQSLDYEVYRFSLKEWIFLLCKASGLLMLIGYLFYDTFLVLLLLPLICVLFYVLEKKQKKMQRKQRLIVQFKDAIILLYSFVSTGNTLEQAFIKSETELLLTYSKEDDIVREFSQIHRKLKMNITIEACMDDFAKRSRLEDIENFARVVAIAKRGGGSMSGIIKNSVESIKSKIESENEIQTLISGKSNEFRLMAVIPAAVLLYMRVFSAGFMDVLYGNAFGICFMSVCLCVYGVALYWGFRMTDIQV